MHATVNLINERLKNAPQEVLDRLLGYLDAITSENDNSIPTEHRNLVLDHMKNSKEEAARIGKTQKMRTTNR